MAKFEPVRALGLMSGTSLDGVDAAEIVTDGETVIEFGRTAFRAYSDQEREILRAALGRWPGEDVRAAQEVIYRAHFEVSAGFAPDVIGFHGQTLAHDPKGRGTHQLGDGAALAQALGCDVVWDFRTSDVAAGGEGAPLAPFFHFALAKAIGAGEVCAFLNLGGVANVSLVDPSFGTPEEPGAVVAFDTGPANALLDDFMKGRTGVARDEDGVAAASGRVSRVVLDGLVGHDYLLRPAPKSLDRDDFAPVLAQVSDMSLEDGAATLTAVTASCVNVAMVHMPKAPSRWFACGGGRRNPTMMAMISRAVGADVEPVEVVDLDGDMLEAQAFGWLAVRVLRGLVTSAPSTTGCHTPVCGGRIARAS